MKKRPHSKSRSVLIRFLTKPRSLPFLLTVGWVLLCIFYVSIYLYHNKSLFSQKASVVKETPIAPNTVLLRKLGFYPYEIKIKKGQEVTFITDTNKPFWPATNSHPVHEIMPEFDPKRPINPKESFKFKFDQVGRWGFHDHLYPQFRGVVVVEDEDTKGKLDLNCDNLKSLRQQQKEQCFDKLLSGTLLEQGVMGALAQLHTLYKTEPDFIRYGCHRHVHVLGEAFYGEYLKNPDFRRLGDLTADTTYCGFGFWHGFLEHLFRERPTVAFTKSFCDSMEKQLGSKIPNILSTCYHGMGHGFIANPPPQTIWGNPQAMIEPALDICDTVSEDKGKVIECHMGTINVLLDWIYERSYGLEPNTEDPLWVCRNQKNHERSFACYGEFTMRIHDVAKQNISKMAEIVDTIENDSIAQSSMHTAIASIIENNLNLTDYGKYITDCYKISPRLQEQCIEGLVHGFLAHGEPGVEYKKAIVFCESKELSEEQRIGCYQKLFFWFEFYYPKTKIASICKTIDNKYQKYCEGKGKI